MAQSMKSFVATSLLVAALLVLMNRVAQAAPLGDWWLALALLVSGLFAAWSGWNDDRLAKRAQAASAEAETLAQAQAEIAARQQTETDIRAERAAQTRAKADTRARVEAEDKAETEEAYGRIRDTEVRADIMASAATTDTQEARSIEGLVENIMDVGATGTPQEVDEIAGPPVGSLSKDQSPSDASVIAASPNAPVQEAASPLPFDNLVQTESPAEETIRVVKPPSILEVTLATPDLTSAEAPPVSDAPPKKARARSGKATAAQADDLTLVEGIGPKMYAALVAAGISTFQRLSQASEAELRAAVEAAGMRLAPSLPTWAEQARFLARGDQDGFNGLVAALKGGRKK